ncbi:MAG: GNAT family N-acetyltransferase [Limnobacter sp.]|nr:GNAT family N-acetyltransferase [Limnobacter sp.]
MSAQAIEWFDIPANLTRHAASLLGLSQVPMQELEEKHRPLILAHLLSLSREDRRMRFSYPLGDAGIAKYLANIDFEQDDLIGIFGKDDVLVGLVHLAYLNPERNEGEPLAAELGLSLRDEARGHGLGSLLFKRAVKRARNHNVERLFIYTLQDNEAMLAIAKKLSMTVSTEGGQCEAHLVLKPSTAYSTVTEFVDDNLSEVDRLFKHSLDQFRKWADLT